MHKTQKKKEKKKHKYDMFITKKCKYTKELEIYERKTIKRK